MYDACDSTPSWPVWASTGPLCPRILRGVYSAKFYPSPDWGATGDPPLDPFGFSSLNDATLLVRPCIIPCDLSLYQKLPQVIPRVLGNYPWCILFSWAPTTSGHLFSHPSADLGGLVPDTTEEGFPSLARTRFCISKMTLPHCHCSRRQESFLRLCLEIISNLLKSWQNKAGFLRK